MQDLLPGLVLIASSTLAQILADIADTLRRDREPIPSLTSRPAAVALEALTAQQEEIARRIKADLERIIKP